MKKIVGIMGAALMLASSMFAADFSARVVMEGSVAGGTIDITKDDDANANQTNFWTLNSKDQKDADALVVSVNGDKAGANFQFWYNYAGNDADLKVRSTNLWFKPIDMVKVTVGDVSVKTYNEMIDYWKVAVGNSADEHNNWGEGGQWSSYATVEGAGLSVEVTPIDGLWINAGVMAPTGSAFATLTKEEKKYGAYGVAAKYSNIAGLPLSVAASWRDNGKGSYKIAAVGADYGNNYAAGVYAMLNTRFFFQDYAFSCLDMDNIVDGVPQMYTWNKKAALKGVAFDNYVKYSVGAFQVMLRAPVTIRTLKNVVADRKAADYDESFANDPSYMSYELKCQYGLNGFTPYIDIENDNAVTFDKNFKSTMLDMNVQAGVALNVGACSIDCGVKVDVPNNDKANLGWSVPFTAAVAF